MKYQEEVYIPILVKYLDGAFLRTVVDFYHFRKKIIL